MWHVDTSEDIGEVNMWQVIGENGQPLHVVGETGANWNRG